MRLALLCTPLLIVVASCSSPPKPPTVDETQRRPANTAVGVELQACKGELQNTRILANESMRFAESAGATAARLSAQQQSLFAKTIAPAPTANSIYTVTFAFGSTQVSLPGSEASALVEQARAAALVVLRGRTDGTSELPAESRVARERAAAVCAYLVAAGVEGARIRTTYQPVGDHAADNGAALGRSLNRRVEIELYPSTPRTVPLTATPQS